MPRTEKTCKTVADFTIGAGETVSFMLSYELSHRPVPVRVDPQERLRATEEMWTTWVAKNDIKCPWDEAVVRSLITLKALTYAPTGGMVAAPTTSLPECIGGGAQLGLPLLLAARRDLDAAGADECRLLR